MRISIASLVSGLLSVACTGAGLEPTHGGGPEPIHGGGPELTRGGSAMRIYNVAGPAPEVIENISYRDIPDDLIVNGDFEDYQDPHVPTGWSVDEVYGYRGMFTPTDGWRGGAVQLVRNAQGQHFLAQTVRVSPNHRYTAQLVYWVVASDSSRGGLYVVDSANGTLVASDEINRPTNGWRIASVSFDSGARTEVTLKIGYPSGMNGTTVYDAVSMFEEDPAFAYQYQTSYRDVIGIADTSGNPVAAQLYTTPADALVPQLSDYVTTLLGAPRDARLAHRAAYAASLPYYLHLFLSAPDGEAGRAAWCQRTSLALGELLAMYGVRTRQIHSTTVQHQFLEYFNGRSWVVFDPYYGIRYVLAGKRLGVGEISNAGMSQVAIEVPALHRVFLLELGYLLPMWASGGFVNGLDM